MTRLETLVILSLGSLVTIPACAVEDSPSSMLADGRSDSVEGKSVKIRAAEEIFMWGTDEVAPSIFDGTATVILGTNNQVVVEGTFLMIEWSADPATGPLTPWVGDRIAKLTVTRPANGTADLVFLLFDTFSNPIHCKSAGAEASAFKSVAIDINAGMLHADKFSFTFQECGITDPTMAGKSWLFGAFPLTWSTNGPLEGKHAYRLTAEIL